MRALKRALLRCASTSRSASIPLASRVPGIWRDWEEDALQGGFDAVIGNPPYVRQELIRDQKPAFQKAFPATYAGTADLYVYFYEQGLKLLRSGGRMSYVVTNKWLRAGYAEKLRDHFATQGWIEFVADFGHAKHFFPDADVFPSVVVVRKPEEGISPETSDVCVIPRDDVPQRDSTQRWPQRRTNFPARISARVVGCLSRQTLSR
ncbi:MAG: Eco57I restriction-modification methylase domain-containing protein [Caulobacteraceae bacterium]|nr:Eco57I restriction-modification methylase domain-containing protein [Caulobacteraceae bacterium]